VTYSLKDANFKNKDMEYSKVTLTFSGPPLVSSILSLDYNATTQIKETFFSERAQPFHARIGVDAQDSAKNYYNALVADYINSGLFTITLVGDAVIIQSIALNTVFTVSSITDCPLVNILIENKLNQVAPIAITGNTFTRNALEPEVSVYSVVETNVLAVMVDVGDGYYENASKPFQYVVDRGTTKLIKVKDISDYVFQKEIKSPAVLNTGNVIVNIHNQPAGALVKIRLYDEYGLTLQYSLDGDSWVETNYFNGILPGNYTAYVKDQFGVIVSKTFTVKSFNPNIEITEAYSFLSDSMSIRFKRDEVWDNVDVYKTDYNTLACEENKLIPYSWQMMFKPEDVIKTQFLSNYTNIYVNAIVNNVRTPIELNTAIRFIGLTDRRDGNLLSLSPGRTGVYFTTGNIYDYATGEVIDTFALNGSLPEYVAKGNYMNLIGIGWAEIIDIIYDEALNADVAFLDYDYLSAQQTINVASLYSQNNYNVYEFVIDMARYRDVDLQVEIVQSMPGFNDYNYLSEVITVGELDPNYYELQWSNNDDGSVFYSTGIKSKANVLVTDFDFKNESEVDTLRTPRTSVLISASNYPNSELVIDAVPTKIAHQLVQALLHKNLYVNKVPFSAVNTPEIEVVKNTNLQFLTCLLTPLSAPFRVT